MLSGMLAMSWGAGDAGGWASAGTARRVAVSIEPGRVLGPWGLRGPRHVPLRDGTASSSRGHLFTYVVFSEPAGQPCQPQRQEVWLQLEIPGGHMHIALSACARAGTNLVHAQL